MKINLFALILAMCLLTMSACTTPATTAPTTTAPSSTSEKAVDLQALFAQMSAKMPEMLQMDAAMAETYYGIPAKDCMKSIVAICSINLNADEIWLLEATDAEALARLKTLAENRLSVKAAELKDYLPDQYAVVQKARILTHGNYLALLVSPDVTTLEAMFQAAIG